MFTGLIQTIGTLKSKEDRGGDQRLQFKMTDTEFLTSAAIGDSIACNGCCLTVVEFVQSNNRRTGFSADVSQETLKLTSLGHLELSDIVNFEKSLTLQQPLGGHLVSGHVDGLARVLSIAHVANAWEIELAAPQSLARYIAKKGSVCLDGISLTVNEVKQNQFSIMIIPHTQEQTNIQQWKVGTQVNLEVDLIARYIERLFSESSTITPDSLSYEKILGSGFAK